MVGTVYLGNLCRPPWSYYSHRAVVFISGKMFGFLKTFIVLFSQDSKKVNERKE